MPQNDGNLTLLVKAEALSDTLKTEDGVNPDQGYKKRAANILGQGRGRTMAWEYYLTAAM